MMSTLRAAIVTLRMTDLVHSRSVADLRLSRVDTIRSS